MSTPRGGISITIPLRAGSPWTRAVPVALASEVAGNVGSGLFHSTSLDPAPMPGAAGTFDAVFVHSHGSMFVGGAQLERLHDQSGKAANAGFQSRHSLPPLLRFTDSTASQTLL